MTRVKIDSITLISCLLAALLVLLGDPRVVSQFEILPKRCPERPFSGWLSPLGPQVRTWPTNPENVAS